MANGDAAEGAGAITPMSLVSTIGFAALIFFLISIPVLPVLPPLYPYSFEAAATLRAADVLGLAAALLFAIRFSGRMAKRIPVLFLVAAALGLVGILSSVLLAGSGIGGGEGTASEAGGRAEATLLNGLCWVLSGAGTGLCAVSWATILCLVNRAVSLRIVVFGTVLGTLVFVAVSLHGGYVPFVVVEYVLLVLILSGAGIYAYRSIRREIAETSVDALSEGHIPLSSAPAALTSFANGSIFGFATLFICSMGMVPGIAIIAAGVVGSVAAAVWILMANPEGSQFDAVMRLSTPLVVIGVLLLPFVDEVVEIACGALIVVALSFCMVSFWIRIPQISAENGYPAIRWFAYRQSLDWLGFLIGGALAAVVLFVAASSEVACIASCIGQAVLVVVFYSMAGAEKRPVDQVPEAGAPEVGQGAEALAGTDAESGQGPLTEEASCLQLPEEAKAALRFIERCDEIAEEASLTRREREVFVLLSKGRNAKAIQEKLYISESTAKTHIYNIYRKLQVSTQQELIDLVESSVDHSA